MNNNGKSDTRGSFLENSLIQRYLVQCTVQTFRNLYKLSPIKINHLSKASLQARNLQTYLLNVQQTFFLAPHLRTFLGPEKLLPIFQEKLR